MGIADLTPPGFEALVFQTDLKKAHKKIPFEAFPTSDDINYKVFFKTNDLKSVEEANNSTEFKNRATNKFLEHYFPEYYPLVLEDMAIAFGVTLATDVIPASTLTAIEPYRANYNTLRQQIFDSITVQGKPHSTFPDGPIKNKVIYQTSLNLRQERTVLEITEGPDGQEPNLPSITNAFEVLNTELGRGESAAAVSVKFQNAPTGVDVLTDTFSPFGELLNQMQQRAGAPNLNTMQSSVNTIIKKITDSVHNSIDFSSERQGTGFYDTDYFTVFFDDDTKIVSIEFFVAGAGPGGPQISKIGYITNIKYNPIFKDPLTLNLLKNYEEILELNQETVTDRNQNSILDFIDRLGLADATGFGQALIGDPVYGLNQDGPFAPRNVDDYVSIDPTGEAMNKALDQSPMTPKRYLELLKLMEEGDINAARMLQAEKARQINTAVQTLDVIDQVASMDFFSFANNTAKGREINRVLQSFGIPDLVQEVLTCLTLGMGESVSRITQAVRDTILNNTVSWNNPPTPPSAQLGIERPNLKEIIPPKFSITGDPPLGRRIVDMILGQIAQGGFEIIKGFAEMLKFNCGDILAALRGDVDCGSELKKRNTQAQVAFPDLAAELEGIAANYGMTLGEAYEYFSAVSLVLNPIEICRLLNSPSAVTPNTIENILDFNEDYNDVVNNTLGSESSIIAFFQAMSSNIDTVSFCNEIIDTNIAAAIEGCEICLDTDLVSEPIALLSEIAENGYQMPLPPMPDLLCPDSENYMANPIAEVSIPRLFNNIVETTQVYLAGSLESARTSILEPVVTTRVNDILSGACESAGVELEPVEIDPAALDMLQNVFNFMDNIADEVQGAPDLCADISEAKFDELVENVNLIVDAVQTVMDEAPEIIEEVTDKINSVRDNITSDPPAVPHTEYVFPEQFATEFSDAITAPNLASNIPGDAFFGGGSLFQVNTKYFGLSEYTYTELSVVYGPPLATQAQQNKFTIYYNMFNNPDDFKGVQVGYQVPSLPIPDRSTSTSPNFAMPDYSAPPPIDAWEDIQLNPYIFRFTDPIAQQSNIPIDSEEYYNLVGEEYPTAYASVMRGIYDYIVENGAFSTDIINNLQLFKDNKNCTPANIGDLFDADGIIDQMRKEFAAAACYDNASSKDKVQGALYFGLLNMLIQTIIDEFVVTNIVVFTALNLEDILDPKYPFKELMVSQVIDSLNKINLDGVSIVERELFNYFNRVSKRPPVQVAGGFTHSYAPTEVVSGFETPNFPINNTEMIRFLVEERLGYTWMDGDTQRSTIRAIKNVIDPTNSNKMFELFFIEDVLGLRESASTSGELKWAIDQASSSAHRAFKSQMYFRAVDGEDIKLIHRTGHDPSWTGTATVLFSIPTPPGTSTRAQKIDLIKDSEEYRLFFNQTINKDACLFAPVLHNFYLTGKYFSDVAGSFDSTKRAVIHMFNLTDLSQSPPALEPRNSEYITSLEEGSSGPDMESMARDIFLKFLRETPINILKGLCELIDPHIAITKIIKDFSGVALRKMSQGIQTSIDGAGEDTPLAKMKEDGITGEDVLGLVFCLYNIANQVPSSMIDFPGQDNLLFGPKLTLDGVDFKGTVTGMVMMPPSPLGLIYLLIELLKIKMDDDLGAEEETIESPSPEPEECPEGTTALDISET